MAELSQRTINSIYAKLEQGRFSLADFSVALDDEALAIITFVPYPEFQFYLNEESDPLSAIRDIGKGPKPTHPITLELPGDSKSRERHSHNSLSAGIDRIERWMQNISSELHALATAPNVERIFEDLEEQVAKFASSKPLEGFNESEVEEIKSKLDNTLLQLEKLEAENSVTKEELERLDQEFSRMKYNLKIYPKSVWYHVSGNRFIQMAKSFFSSKEARDFMLDAAKKYFLGS